MSRLQDTKKLLGTINKDGLIVFLINIYWFFNKQGNDCFDENNAKQSPLSLSSISRMLGIDGNNSKNLCIKRAAYNPNLAVSLDSATLPRFMSQKRDTEINNRSPTSIITSQRHLNSYNSSHQNDFTMSQGEESTSSSSDANQLTSLTSLGCLEDGLQEYTSRNESINIKKYQKLIDPENFATVQELNQNEFLKEKKTTISDDDATATSPNENKLSFLESEDEHVEFLKQVAMETFGTTALLRGKKEKSIDHNSKNLSNMERGGEVFGMTPFREIEDEEDPQTKGSNNEFDRTIDTTNILDDEAVVSPVSALQQLTSLKTDYRNHSLESIADFDYQYVNDISKLPSHRTAHQWKYFFRGLVLSIMLFAPLFYHKFLICGHYQFHPSKSISEKQKFDSQESRRSFAPQFLESSYNTTVCTNEKIPTHVDTHTNAGSFLENNLKPNTTELVISHNAKKRLKQPESFSGLLKKEKTYWLAMRIWKVLCFSVSFPVYSLTKMLFHLMKSLLSKDLIISKVQYDRKNDLDMDFFLIL